MYQSSSNAKRHQFSYFHEQAANHRETDDKGLAIQQLTGQSFIVSNGFRHLNNVFEVIQPLVHCLVQIKLFSFLCTKYQA